MRCRHNLDRQPSADRGRPHLDHERAGLQNTANIRYRADRQRIEADRQHRRGGHQLVAIDRNQAVAARVGRIGVGLDRFVRPEAARVPEHKIARDRAPDPYQCKTPTRVPFGADCGTETPVSMIAMGGISLF